MKENFSTELFSALHPSPSSEVVPASSSRKLDRRDFLKYTSIALGAALPLPGHRPFAGPFEASDILDHFVPADKKLRPEWLQSLYARGERTWYQGKNLDTIGMPVGGICAGQVYLTGDGRLTYWDIFNQQHNSGYGAHNYQVGRNPNTAASPQALFAMPPLQQGVAIRARQGSRVKMRPLDREGFSDVRFCGEYPVAYVEYPDARFPVEVKLEAFSPFIPLNDEDSSLPATLLNYSLKNTTHEELEVQLVGWLQNAVCRHSQERFGGRMKRVNRLIARDGMTAILCRADKVETVPAKPVRPPLVFADFEGGDYGAWNAEGKAFGVQPAQGALERQNPVSGFKGKGLVNTFLGGDEPHGKLISPEFTIERKWISFLVGGGSKKNETCMNLLVDGKAVRTITGKDSERLEPANWNVEEFAGKPGRLEIVDAASGGWGHINIDQIEFRDEPLNGDPGNLDEQLDFGTLSLAVLNSEGAFAQPEISADDINSLAPALFKGSPSPSAETTAAKLSQPFMGCVGQSLTLKPGQQQTVTLVVSWHMPNLHQRGKRVGNHYAKRFKDAADVAGYIARNQDRLIQETRLWHDSYYDSTLPYWLLDRLHSTVCNLATTTCQRWENGRFWAWEGCGCCHGTCGHVWNYEHALARLFPQAERSVREMQDFKRDVGLWGNGAIAFRGEGWGMWAGDSQGGYILKAYREHQMTQDDAFLKRNWNNIRLAVEFLIKEDGNSDGVLEGSQHQTYDQNYFGANTMVGSLYLGALRAAEEMAREVGDGDFAQTCRQLFESGSKLSSQRLFNGEYYIQEVDLKKHPEWQYAEGCLADQMFGQGWARQVGLGYLYPDKEVRSTLEAIWKYCWAPDIGTQNQTHKPERWFAYPGEAGLFTCTWPKSKHLGPKSTRYRNEIWTGIEYQVAGHMVWEDMVTEGLAICRAIHDRYHPAKHNPWNEIECGDHYARALASWGVFLGLCGFDYHGPAQRMGIAPRLSPENFKAVFTGAEGWGTVSQTRTAQAQVNRKEVKWGRLALKEVVQQIPKAAQVSQVQARIDGKVVPAKWSVKDSAVRVTFEPQIIEAGHALEVHTEWAA